MTYRGTNRLELQLFDCDKSAGGDRFQDRVDLFVVDDGLRLLHSLQVCVGPTLVLVEQLDIESLLLVLLIQLVDIVVIVVMF